ncbi:hypothetical protein TTRE_0000166801 [Trichuris trichiura]|uniref:Uncharacterized protein n=1 Tax=Trichuris trichiura TaxID=36087 RepID=A0A077Z104_TRITR|nr:hypothetical protein TTRE_0000166801 [Trichuris trichiura]
MEFFLNKIIEGQVDEADLLKWISSSTIIPETEKAKFGPGNWNDETFKILQDCVSLDDYSQSVGAAQIYSLLVMCKRAQVPKAWINKHIELLRQETGARCDFFPADSVTTYLHTYFVAENDNWPKYFQNMLRASEGTTAEMNIVLQAEFGGLTAYTLVKDAQAHFPSFAWEAMATIFPNEQSVLNELTERVKENHYYGFGPEARTRGSTKFPHMFYVAKTLFTEFQGDNSMRAYRGDPKMTRKDLCDKLLRDFRPLHKLQMVAGPAQGTHAIVAEIKKLQEQIESANEAQLFIDKTL